MGKGQQDDSMIMRKTYRSLHNSAALPAAVGIALAEAVLGPTVANTFPVSASLIQRRNGL